MLDTLSERLQGVVRKLRGRGVIDEKNISEAMREIRMALIEADVNFRIARDFVRRTAERCRGQDVLKSVTPGQQFVKIVHDELTELMGGRESAELDLSANPAVVLLAGLHGCGKTTTAAKLALWAKKRKGRSPLLVACDVYRPAAVDQLETLGRQIDVPVHCDRGRKDAVAIAEAGVRRAREEGRNLVIVDTAGRLHIDEDLVDELVRIREAIRPHEILLVADAATGQEAVAIAGRFHEALGLTGIILTKLDGDARGGAALSMREAAGRPIKFVGTGEKIDAFQPFHPDRMASRILGMGDVLSLVERAQETIEEDSARRMEEKLRRNTINLEDFLDQLQQVRKMGSMREVLGMLPGMPKIPESDLGENDLVHVEAIIRSMTPEERRRPEILNGSRRRRIARGSGTTVAEVNQLIKQFTMMKRALRQMGGGRGGVPRGFGGAAGLRKAMRRAKKR